MTPPYLIESGVLSYAEKAAAAKVDGDDAAYANVEAAVRRQLDIAIEKDAPDLSVEEKQERLERDMDVFLRFVSLERRIVELERELFATTTDEEGETEELVGEAPIDDTNEPEVASLSELPVEYEIDELPATSELEANEPQVLLPAAIPEDVIQGLLGDGVAYGEEEKAAAAERAARLRELEDQRAFAALMEHTKKWAAGCVPLYGMRYWDVHWDASGSTDDEREAYRVKLLLGASASYSARLASTDTAHLEKVGDAIVVALKDQSLLEFAAIINGNQSVIDAWLSQHAPDYKDSLIYQQVDEGCLSDPDHTPADKIAAAAGWVRKSLPDVQSIVEALASHLRVQ